MPPEVYDSPSKFVISLHMSNQLISFFSFSFFENYYSWIFFVAEKLLLHISIYLSI